MEQALKKLGYQAQPEVLVLNAPKGIQEALLPLLAEPADGSIQGSYDFLLAFVTTLDEIRAIKADLAAALRPQGRLWICYPKRTSKNYMSDLSRDILWPEFGEFNFEPVSQFAIDPDWSAMRFRPVDEIKSLKRKSASSEKGSQRIHQE